MPQREDTVYHAISRGRNDYVDGVPLERCPFPLGTVAAMQWVTEWIHEDQECSESVHALCQQRGRMAK